MPDPDKIAPAQESKDEPVKSPDAVVPETKKETTVGDALNPALPEKKEDTVPLSTFLEVKNANKELTREMKELKKSIEAGATKKEVSADISALADKHGVDADFLQDFAAAVRAEAKKEADEAVASKLKPLEDKERMQKIEEAFGVHYTKALEALPEYTGLVNRDVIKNLSLLPQNANKTFTQLIEEAYGHLVTGKRSVDPATTTRASKTETGDVDMERATRDPGYFKEIMENPVLKEKYNRNLVGKVSSYI